MATKITPMISIDGAISTAYSVLTELRDELQSWRDNLPDNLQGGSKAEELDAAISDLEGACDYEPEMPECFADCDTSTVLLPEPKAPGARASRSQRRDYAASLMCEAIGRMQQWRDDETDEIAQQAHREANDGLLSRDAIEASWEDRVSTVEYQCDAWCDEVESHVDAVEGVEFPGMRS